MTYARKVDANHSLIVKTLREMGCSVFDTSRVAGGFPDLVCGKNGKTALVEIKADAKAKKSGHTDLSEYIVLDGRTSSQEQGKSGYTNSNTIVVDIITKNANFGYKRAETISDLVLTAINSQTTITLSNGFYASSVYVNSISNLDGLNPLDNVFRTLITYNIIITQN